jgi:hypothetical protein
MHFFRSLPLCQNIVNGIYIETLYNFFQIHNVSSRNYYIRSLNSAVAPYIDISDERLHWLNVTFPNYIEDVATCWKPVTATNNTSATTSRSIGRFPNDRLKMASPATAYEP